MKEGGREVDGIKKRIVLVALVKSWWVMGIVRYVMRWMRLLWKTGVDEIKVAVLVAFL